MRNIFMRNCNFRSRHNFYMWNVCFCVLNMNVRKVSIRNVCTSFFLFWRRESSHGSRSATFTFFKNVDEKLLVRTIKKKSIGFCRRWRIILSFQRARRKQTCLLYPSIFGLVSVFFLLMWICFSHFFQRFVLFWKPRCLLCL